MVWKVLRPHYWMLDRRVRASRGIVMALALLLGFGGPWVYDNLIRDNLALLGSEQAIVAIASSLPWGLFLLLLFGLLGVGDTMHQLYLAPDLELLMVAPVPYPTIFMVKLLQCSRATLVPALFWGVFLFALGAGQGAGAVFYLLIGLLILGAMILTTASVLIFVILLARLLPAQKVRAWMPVATILATLILALSQQSVGGWFLSQTNLSTFLTEALLNQAQLSLVVAGLVGCAFAVSLTGYQIFAYSFHEGWNRFRVVPIRLAAISQGAGRTWKAARLVQPLPAPLRYFLVKEWLELRRNPRGLITLAQPFVLVVMVLVPFLGSDSEALRPIIFWFMLAFLMLFLSTLPLNTSLMAIAEEGHRMALLRSAPISMSEVLKGKFWAIWVPVVSSWVLVFLGVGWWLRLHLWQTGFLVGVTVWGLTGTSVATTAICGLKVDFMAEELKQRVSTLVNCLIIGLNGIFVLLTSATIVWVMVRLFPDRPVVLAIRALAGYGVVGWLFSANLWNPAALMIVQVVFWIGVRKLWDAAVRRLEAWEGG